MKERPAICFLNLATEVFLTLLWENARKIAIGEGNFCECINLTRAGQVTQRPQIGHFN